MAVAWSREDIVKMEIDRIMRFMGYPLSLED
jgi:hypothetical protein